MMSVKVKICGITNYDDAVAAVELGADIIGFNFYSKSPRYITPDDAAELISRLPAFINTAGIFVNETFAHIRKIVNHCQLDWIQLHGDEDPRFCKKFLSLNVKLIKALRVKDSADIKKAEKFFTDAILLDAYRPEKYGGTGHTFDWNIIGTIEKRVFLAGGINPENVVDAVKLGVYGIDACSGIEAKPGKKDHDKMKKLFDNIKHLRA